MYYRVHAGRIRFFSGRADIATTPRGKTVRVILLVLVIICGQVTIANDPSASQAPHTWFFVLTQRGKMIAGDGVHCTVQQQQGKTVK
jgi:hypothetical protein